MIEQLYVVTSLLLTSAGITIVALSARAYLRTARRAMIHLSLGFSLIVAATIATTVSAFLTDFSATQSLLFVNSGLNTLGYLFVVYSLISYGSASDERPYPS